LNTGVPPPTMLLDPFAGTGRAVTVAFRHGMNAIGFEISPAFVKVAKKLLAENGA
jgi:DNA modification methylase